MTSTVSPTRRGIGLRGAEILLWAGIAASLAFGLSVILGPNGLGLVTIRSQWPIVGQSAYAMSIDTPFNDNAGISIANAPRIKQASNGDVDAVTGGPPVEIGGPFSGPIGFLNPTFAMQWAWIYWQAAGPLLAAGSLFVVLKVVRSVRTGTPFTRENVRRLRIVALLVGLGGTFVAATDEIVRRWLLDNSAVADIVIRDWHLSFVPLLAGVLIAVVAEVWRAGVAIADDLDGVV